MTKDPVLYGPYSEVLTLPSQLDTTTQADTGRVQHGDRWSREIRDVSPETLVRVLRNQADLGEQFALCDRIYVDAHFLAVANDRVSTVAGAEWEVLPYTDSPRASARSDDRKVADSVAEKLYGIASLETYFEHLVWGDGLYPLNAAETRFNPSTFLPEGFNITDGARFRYVGNELRLLTEAHPATGESLKPGLWTIHSLSPQNPRKTRLFKALAFYYMVARLSTIDWLSFAEKYGKPIPIAYFSDPSDKASLIEAVMRIGVDFAGVLPASAKLDLQQALNASKDIYEGLAKFAHNQVTKAVCGHTLIVDAQSGSGTLAGEGAQRTNLKVAKAVAKRVAASVRQGLIRTIVALHHGPRYLSRLPVLQYKVEPPEDAKQRASTYVEWNRVVEAAGLMIDPEHVKEVAGVPNLVPRVAASGANVQPPPKSEGSEVARGTTPPTAVTVAPQAMAQVRDILKDVAADQLAPKTAAMMIESAGYSRDAADEMVAEQKRHTAAGEKEFGVNRAAPVEQAAQRRSERPVIRTLTDAVIAGVLMQQRASQEEAAQVLSFVEEAKRQNLTPAAMRDFIVEQYDRFDHTKAGEALAEGMVVAEAIATAKQADRATKNAA